jgi:recombination endonuclease VII
MLSRLQWKKRYAQDPEYREKVLAQGRAYHLAHKEEIAARKSRKWKTDPAYRERQYARLRKCQRKVQLKFDYNMSLEQYDALLARQGGVCAICRIRSERPLCVDHCHRTDRIRGLLCRTCNSGLGFFNDDPALLRAATAYLEAARDDACRQATIGQAAIETTHEDLHAMTRDRPPDR